MNESIIDTLIWAVTSTKDVKVRVEAIRSLATYMDDPKVLKTLQWAVTSGGDTEVRTEAVKVLGKR